MSDEKIYCGNGRIVSGKFGDIIKISAHKEDLKRVAQYLDDTGGDWVNFELKKKKSPEQGKPTHYLQIDTWKPDANKEPEPVKQDDVPSNDLPF